MLDPQQPVDLPGIPVRAFRDHVRPQAFYLMPLAPSVALEDDGRPSVSLAVFGRKRADGSFDAQGALLTLTTVLEVSRATHDRARAALSRWLAAEAARTADEGGSYGGGAHGGRRNPNVNQGAGPAAEPPPVEIQAVEWITGTVTIRLTDRVTVTGRPSLTAPNACALNERIARDAVAALVEAWRNGLPDARITYALQARTAGAAGRAVDDAVFQFDGPFGLDRDRLGETLAMTGF